MSDGTTITANDFLAQPEEQSPVEQQEAQEAAPQQSDEDAILSEIMDDEPQAEEIAAPEDEDLESEVEAEEKAEVPPPPTGWAKEDAEVWSELPERAREIIAKREKDQHAFIAETGRKTAEAKREIEQQAMEAVAKQAETHALQLQAYAQQFLPEPPDINLLYSEDPSDIIIYQRQDAAYRAAISQQQELQQQVAQLQRQADEARSANQSVLAQAEAERLRVELPEFFDPEAGPKLRQSLESIGQELGYRADELAQAGAVDIMAMKKANEWREKAAKYDRIVAKRMETVRSAKKLPTMSRPGAAIGRAPANSANDFRTKLNTFEQTRSPESAAALLLERKR